MKKNEITNRKEVEELISEIKNLKSLLRETIMAMCSYRAMKGKCTACNAAVYCRPKKIIPMVEKALKINNDGTIFTHND